MFQIVKPSFQTDDTVQELNHMLMRYNLTLNQAKVYVFLSKTGINTASMISKTLELPRTETYHLLSILQQKGIIFSILGKPTKFDAINLEESLEILINNEKKRVKELEDSKKGIVKLWNKI